MGLHQHGTFPDNAGQVEIHERRKIFRSLYIRDQALAISHGAPSWLSSLDLMPPVRAPTTESGELTSDVRLELAKLQSEAYRLLHPVKSSSQKLWGLKALLALEERLERFSREHQLPRAFYSESLREADLQLAFLGTRIYILSAFDQPTLNQRKQILDDTRLSLLLILPLQSDEHSTLREMFHGIVGSRKSLLSAGAREAGEAKLTIDQDEGYSGRSIRRAFHCLVIALPVTSLFHLARNVVWATDLRNGFAVSSTQDHQLLAAVCACFQHLETPPVHIDTYVYAIGRVLESLTQIIAIFRRSSSPDERRWSPDQNKATSPFQNDTFDAYNASLSSPDSSSWRLTSQSSRQSLCGEQVSLHPSTPPTLTDMLSFESGSSLFDLGGNWPGRGSADQARKRQRITNENDDCGENICRIDDTINMQEGARELGNIFHSIYSRGKL